MSNVDITKLTHMELCAEYDRAMAVFAKVIERAGGNMRIPADAWGGENKLVRVWYELKDNGDVEVKLEQYTPEEEQE